MRSYSKLLRRQGVNIGSPIYIDLTTWFDSVDYTKITIEDDVVISREVSVLVHDYSISRGLVSIGKTLKKEYVIIKPVHIGKNSFIGLRSVIMPGTHIGESCIIGAGSIVTGKVEPFSIMAGNPAQKIGDIRDWTIKKINEIKDIQDYIGA